MMSSPAMQVAAETQRCIAPVQNSVGRIIPIFDEEYCTPSALLETLEHTFTFNGETNFLGPDVDWLRNPSKDVEWHILLHKFYYAPGLARRFSTSGDVKYKKCFEDLVRSWISDTPIGFIAADVSARRVQNWIYAWWLCRQHDPNCFSPEFEDELLVSLADQVEFICANLAAARNHRTLGLYAIFLASVALPESAKRRRWREFSVRELLDNIENDLLGDGVHCELSTDYHHIVLRSYLLFLRIAKMNDIALPESVAHKVSLALDFSMFVHRPDGNIPALSDSDSRSFLELLEWGAELFDRPDYAFVASGGLSGVPPATQHKVFADSGYAILRSAWKRGEPFRDARYLVFDAGPVGAGNHGHLDALNIEVAAFGRPLLIDPGRFTYDEQGDYNWRAHFRQTAAHNTVTVNGCDQAIYRQRGAKRKIGKPRPACTLIAAEFSDDMAYLHGVVSSPNYRALHHRHIWFADNSYWVILDRMLADDPHDYELRFQLSADANNQLGLRTHDLGTEINAPGVVLFIAQRVPLVKEEPAYVSSSYGSKIAAPRICAQATAADYCFLSVLVPTRAPSPGIKVEDVGSGPLLSINRGAYCDSWQWSSHSRCMTHHSRARAQHWIVPKADHHGE